MPNQENLAASCFEIEDQMLTAFENTPDQEKHMLWIESYSINIMITNYQNASDKKNHK